MLNRFQKGRNAEDKAVQYLEQEGYKVLGRNVRMSLGEIDIVALDKETVCFVEVKSKGGDRLGSPLEAVTKTKQRKLSRLALAYLKQKRLLSQKARFDVVSIVENPQGQGGIQVLKNAFELSGPYSY